MYHWLCSGFGERGWNPLILFPALWKKKNNKIPALLFCMKKKDYIREPWACGIVTDSAKALSKRELIIISKYPPPREKVFFNQILPPPPLQHLLKVFICICWATILGTWSVLVGNTRITDLGPESESHNSWLWILSIREALGSFVPIDALEAGAKAQVHSFLLKMVCVLLVLSCAWIKLWGQAGTIRASDFHLISLVHNFLTEDWTLNSAWNLGFDLG